MSVHHDQSAVHQKNLARGLKVLESTRRDGLSLVRYSNGETWLVSETEGRRLMFVYGDNRTVGVWYVQSREGDRVTKMADDVPLKEIRF